MFKENTVVISGAGCMLPGCNSLEDFWALTQGNNDATSAFDDEFIESDIIKRYGEIDQAQNALAKEAVPFKLRRYATPCSSWGYYSLTQALKQAQFDIEKADKERIGIFTAQADYQYPSLPAFAAGVAQTPGCTITDLHEEFSLRRGMDAFLAIKALSNNALAINSLALGARGDCGAFIQNASATISALQSAIFSLKSQQCDSALVTFSGSYREGLTLAELYQSGQLSPSGEYRPFQPNSDGLVLAEGAVALVLERAESCLARSATPLAKINAVQGRQNFKASQAQAEYEQCIDAALDAAKITFEQLDAAVSQGCGIRHFDALERNVLDKKCTDKTLPLTAATKNTGKVAGCPTELLMAILMLSQQKVPAAEPPIFDRPIGLSATSYPLNNILAVNQCFTGYCGATLISSFN